MTPRNGLNKKKENKNEVKYDENEAQRKEMKKENNCKNSRKGTLMKMCAGQSTFDAADYEMKDEEHQKKKIYNKLSNKWAKRIKMMSKKYIENQRGMSLDKRGRAKKKRANKQTDVNVSLCMSISL